MGVHISFVKVKFSCPFCTKPYDDSEELFLDRCNKKKSGITYYRCECKNRFGVTHDIKGDIVVFEPSQ